MITFEPLWETLKRKNISIYKLINTYGLSRGTLSSLKHDKNVTANTIDWLCEVLDCEITDVMKYVRAESADTKTDTEREKECDSSLNEHKPQDS